jgi:hypothetical protein
LLAQDAPPPSPDTAALVNAGRPAYLQSLQQVAAPVILAETPYRLLVAPAATAATLDAADVVDTLSRACRTEGSVSAPAGYTPGGVAVDATKYLVVVALTAAPDGAGCAAAWNSSALSIWSGLALGGRDTSRSAVPRALRLLANGVEVKPVLSVARPARELRGTTWHSVPPQLRYYYPMNVLASAVDGTRPELVVVVWNTSGAATSYELSRADGERMQYAYAVWRLATTSGAAAPVRLTPRHAVSPDVRAALISASAGSTDSAALRAAEWLSVASPGKGTEYDRDVASMLVAEALVQRHDTAGARGLVSSVRTRRECLVPPQGASSTLAGMITGVRTSHCPEHNPLTTLAAGVVFPGGGHYLHSSRLLAFVATGAITSVFASAYSIDASAKRNYARYEASRLETQAKDLYNLATNQRATARARARIGLIVWGADAVLASVITTALNHEVARGRL